jgi:DNA-binding response OmpR family regulator
MHILLIEDDPRVADLVERGLQEQGYAVTTAPDGQSGLCLATAGSFDLLLIDIMLPDLSGLDVCRQIRQQYPLLPILVLTALGTTDDKLEGFDSGANDYLVKPFDFRELLARIKELLRRRAAASPAEDPVLRVADLEMNLETRLVKRAGTEIDLTPKEFALLQFLLQHQGRVLPRAEIAEKVWDTHFDTGTNFIDVYINYLRKKIDKNFEPKLIHTKSGVGFILKEG